MEGDPLLRPRWGTFSVIDHQQPAALIPEILLYDRLVFPVPTADDRPRWIDEGWKPELLDERLKELEGLVHAAKWTPKLREEWAARWEQMKTLGYETRGVAMGQTPAVLALSAFNDQVPPPIMIVAYQDPAAAKADVALTEYRHLKSSKPPDAKEPNAREREHAELQREVRALFERRLDMPAVMHPYDTYKKAIALAHDAKYQHARRSLFAWEDDVVAKGWPSEAAVKKLEELVDAHDDFIRSHFAKTLKRSVYRIVEFAASPAVSHATGEPLLGLAASGVVKLVGARLPEMSAKPGDPLDQPSAALHKAISVMYHE
jgi:hypothetical protein